MLTLHADAKIHVMARDNVPADSCAPARLSIQTFCMELPMSIVKAHGYEFVKMS